MPSCGETAKTSE